MYAEREIQRSLMVREAAKGLLYTQTPRGREYVVVRSNTRWSLPGGGIDKGEKPLDALKRECDEELGYRLGRIARQAFTNPQPIGTVEGTVTSNGKMLTARWSIWTGGLPQDIDIMGARGLDDEISSIATMPLDDFQRLSSASQLAVKAMRLHEQIRSTRIHSD